MTDADDRESLMVSIMNSIADAFGNHAILKGGMVLRLLDCPRTTNDLDYVFVPFSSKNEIKDQLIEALGALPGAEISCSLNSKTLRCLVRQKHRTVQVEVQVELACASQELSTAVVAKAHQQQGRIIRVMQLDVALAHKLAAWNERRLVRDLYDIYFLYQLAGAKPHLATLTNRLCNIQSRLPGAPKRARLSLAELADVLDGAAADLTPAAIHEQLRDYLVREELIGLEIRLPITMRRVASLLRSPPS